MTQQAKDYLEADGKLYTVSSNERDIGSFLDCLGLQITCGSTGCYRGWFARWTLNAGRLYITHLTVLTSIGPKICNVEPEHDFGETSYEGLLLPIGFTGELTAIPAEDEKRVRDLYYCIPENDEIVPMFGLYFDKGRLKSVSNQSYLLVAGEDSSEPWGNVKKGQIFGEVPTPFDELVFKDFWPWEKDKEGDG